MGAGTAEGPALHVPEFPDSESQLAWWTDRIHEWQASGVSQAVFAQARGIPITTFNWWKRRILKQAPGRKRVRRAVTSPPVDDAAAKSPRKRGRPKGASAKAKPPSASSTSFLPVRVVPGSTAPTWWLEVACRNGRVLRLRDAIELPQLAALIAALES